MSCIPVQCKNGSSAMWIVSTCVLAAFFVNGAALGDDAKQIAPGTTTERLTEAARQAEIDGDTARCFALLREAIRVEPDYALARWQLGQVKVDGEWIAVEEAQRRAAADPKQAQYRDLRKAHGETPEGQLALARWCRKNDLHEEATFHWASVLSVDPANEEALRAVDMQWSNGRLLSREEIIRQKKQFRESKRAIKQFAPTIAKWRRAMSSGDATKREEVLEEIRSLRTIELVPPIEAITLGRDAGEKKHAKDATDISLAFLEALEKIPEQGATESLIRHAVYSAIADVRTSAIEKLKPRPHHDYVPFLLSGLSLPIESSFAVRTDAGGSVQYSHSLYREGPDADWSVDLRRSAIQHQLDSRTYRLDIHKTPSKWGRLPNRRSP